jgi:hypothetical protein
MTDTTVEKIQIPLKTRIAVLTIQPFTGDIDVESLVQIDYVNILGDILTFPVVFNRIANLRAEAQNLLNRSKFDLEMFEAQLYEEHRNKIVADEKKPSIKEIDMAVLRDPRYKVKKYEFIENQKYFDYCDALYWSAQSKDTKLNRLVERIRPAEFEDQILEETINGIKIRMVKKSIQ